MMQTQNYSIKYPKFYTKPGIIGCLLQSVGKIMIFLKTYSIWR